MNISLIQLKGVVRELAGIRSQLTRIADCLEYDLADKGIRVRPDDRPQTDASVEYVDEQIDWGRENIPNFDSMIEKMPKE